MVGRVLLCVCAALTPAIMLLFTGHFAHGTGAQAAGEDAAAQEKKAGRGRARPPFAKLWKRSALAMLFFSLALTLPFLGGNGTALAVVGIILCVMESLVLLLLLFAWKEGEARRKRAELEGINKAINKK